MTKHQFLVDYMYGNGNSNCRMKIQGNSLSNLKTATSDFAVQEYVQSRHPNSKITIMSIKWI